MCVCRAQAALVEEWSQLSIDQFLCEPVKLEDLQRFINITAAESKVLHELRGRTDRMFVGVVCDDFMTGSGMLTTAALNRLQVKHQLIFSDALYELAFSEFDVVVVNHEVDNDNVPCDEVLLMIDKWSSRTGKIPPPVVVVTSESPIRLEQHAMAAAFLQKPYTASALGQILLDVVVVMTTTAASKEEEAARLEDTSDTGRMLSKVHLSVLGDSREASSELCRCLKMWKCTYDFVGTDAVAKCTQSLSDAVVIDVSKTGDLPFIVGSLRRCGNIKPIIAIGQGSEECDQEAKKAAVLKAGANTYLARPWLLEQLKESIVSIMAYHDGILKPAMIDPDTAQNGPALVQGMAMKDLVISIVCDNKMMRTTLAVSLRKTGARCQPLSSDFTDAAVHSDSDVVIIDSSRQPKESRTLDALAQARHLRIPTLVITAANNEGLEKLTEAGAAMLLPRPFDVYALFQSINEAITSSGGRKWANKVAFTEFKLPQRRGIPVIITPQPPPTMEAAHSKTRCFRQHALATQEPHCAALDSQS